MLRKYSDMAGCRTYAYSGHMRTNVGVVRLRRAAYEGNKQRRQIFLREH